MLNLRALLIKAGCSVPGDNFPPLNPEGKVYDPDGYNLVQVLRAIGGLMGAGGIIFGLAAQSPAGWLIAIPGFLVLGIAESCKSNHEQRVASIKRNEMQATLRKTADIHRQGSEIIEGVNKVSEAIKDIRESAIRTGDVIVNGPDAAIVIGSGSIEIVRGTKTQNPELAEAIKEILGHIENTRNQNAAEYFEKLLKESDKEKPDKTVLKALWDSTLSAAPAIKSFSEAAAAIGKMIG